MRKLEELVGVELTGIKINADKTAIILETGEGPEHLACYADCCSRTWIEHMNIPRMPTKIKRIVHDNMVHISYWYCEELIQVYATKFLCETGESLTVEFRNESNGYYGGSLELLPGDTYGRQDENQEFVQVTEDF